MLLQLTRFALAACVAAVVASVGIARAAEHPGLELRALTGPAGAELYVTAPDQATVLERVHVQVGETDDPTVEPRMLNLADVPTVDGVATVELGDEIAGTPVNVTVHAKNGAKPATVLYRGQTVIRLRPDLTLRTVEVFRPCETSSTGCAATQTLVTQPVDVVATIDELNGETAAVADVTLELGSTTLARLADVSVTAGGEKTVRFEDVALTTAMTAELTVGVLDAAPFETDTSNNDASTKVEVTEHELVPSNVLVQALGGWGAQFNNHLYAPITPWPDDLAYADHETKAVELQPHLVRIFFQDNWDANWIGTHPEWEQNYASFVDVVRLAQEAGATIDISFQNLSNARTAPAATMTHFADVLQDLVVNHGLTSVRWAEVGNEPNSGAVTFAEYNTLVRTLDSQLVARGLDSQVRIMGPGLVENNGVPARSHYPWMQWLAANMGDVIDAWGEHVYWNYNDPGRLEYRLRDSWHLLNTVLPPEQRKPDYMMEYGVRGLGTCGTKPASTNTYYAADATCPEIWRTNIAGFQQLWFAIDAAQLGYTGASKWDAYWAVYDLTKSPPQVYWTVGPPTEGSPLTPSYHALWLLFHTTVPGWQIVRVDPWDESDWSVPTWGIEGHSSSDTPEKELAAFAGPDGELTIMGLDTHGRDLNVASPGPSVPYSIGGLPPNTNFNLIVWNAAGDGTNTVVGTVPTNSDGVVRFNVPLQGAFSLTTLPVS